MKSIALLLIFVSWATCLLPPRFQWKVLDFAWNNNSLSSTNAQREFVAENAIPSGVARWGNKLFITLPRWKKGVPASLAFVYLNGSQSQPLIPYPKWSAAFVSENATSIKTDETVVSAFRAHVDQCDRLWVVDNGVIDMAVAAAKVSKPAIVIFDLKSDRVIRRYLLPDKVLRETSVLSSIVIDIVEVDNRTCNMKELYAYITDMGSNAIIVFSPMHNEAWRVEHPYFGFDPVAAVCTVGGERFFWNDGLCTAALSKVKQDGFRDVYLYPVSSTKQFKMSTRLLRSRYVPNEELFDGVEIIGDRGPNSQATACDIDLKTNVLLYTQLCKNGVGCWNLDKPFSTENLQCIISDCNALEFPNDIKIDADGDAWILSNRLSRFLYDNMDFREINFRILTAPVRQLIKGTACEQLNPRPSRASLLSKPSSHNSCT